MLGASFRAVVVRVFNSIKGYIMKNERLAETIKIGMNYNQADLLFFLLCVNFDILDTISKHVPINSQEYGELIAKLHIELGKEGKPSDQVSLFEHIHVG